MITFSFIYVSHSIPACLPESGLCNRCELCVLQMWGSLSQAKTRQYSCNPLLSLINY